MKWLVAFSMVLALRVAAGDVVLSPAGTLFIVEHETNGLVVHMTSSSGETTAIVPASERATSSGAVYDRATGTLFVVWTASGEIVISALRDGKWTRSPYIVAREAHDAASLSVTLTRQAQTADGTDWIEAPALHIAWWSDRARYAIVSLSNGEITSAGVHDLAEFAEHGAAAPANRDALRREWVTFVAPPDSRFVEAFFVDVRSSSLQHVRLKPVDDHRIRIPIGIRPRTIPLPDNNFQMAGALWLNEDGVVLFNRFSDTLEYLIYDGRTWTPLRRVSIGSADAVTLLMRVVTER